MIGLVMPRVWHKFIVVFLEKDVDSSNLISAFVSNRANLWMYYVVLFAIDKAYLQAIRKALANVTFSLAFSDTKRQIQLCLA